MLKEQNVIIANMTKETLKDILSRLLMGLEPPLSLSEVPETKIVEGIYVIYEKDISCHFGDGAHRIIARNTFPSEVMSSTLMLTLRGLTGCKTDRNHSMLNAWTQNVCLNCFNSHNYILLSSPLSLLHFCSCFEKNISRPHVECTRVHN